ncbi:MAG TPA: ABC transporter substrate-binding protein [Patescibacteria group bacterium]|nr:ABC transporter substrate-binding protein [Patescibacteria group bacterium]
MNRIFQRRRPTIILCMLLALGCLLTATGCKPPQPASENDKPAGRTITDMAGRTVKLPAQINKVYATSPVGTIFVYTLAPDKLASWNYFMPVRESTFILPEYRNLPVINGWLGSNNFGNVEEIIKLNPDVILYTRLPGQMDKVLADDIQKRLNIPVVVMDAPFTEMEKAYEFLGRLLQREERAGALGNYCRETMADIEKQRSQIPVPLRVYYAEGIKGLETEPQGSMHTEVIELLGVNVADTGLGKGGPTGRSQVSMEQVMNWKPELLIVAYFPEGESSSYENILNEEKWKNLTAVRARRVYEVPNAPFNWVDRPPSVNRIIGVKWMANLLYPDLYSYDMPAEVKRFYELFYHYRLSDQEVEALLKRGRH